jgi:hypothetical protein
MYHELEKMIEYRILAGKPERKRPLGKLRHKWVDNTEMDLKEIGSGGMDWNDIAYDREQWMFFLTRE